MSYDEFRAATEAELQPMRVHEGTMGERVRSIDACGGGGGGGGGGTAG